MSDDSSSSSSSSGYSGGSGTIIEADSDAMEHFLETVITLQEQDPECIKLVSDTYASTLLRADSTGSTAESSASASSSAIAVPSTSSSSSLPPVVVHPINSLVFEVLRDKREQQHEPKYILAILGAQNRVNVTSLEKAVLEYSQGAIETDERRSTIQLAAHHRVERLSGFRPGTVPPLGMAVPPVVTIVDQSLVVLQQQAQASNSNPVMLLGGGGQPNHSCLVALSTLLQLANVHVADIGIPQREHAGSTSKSKKNNNINGANINGANINGANVNGEASEERFVGPKPFFPVSPPDTVIAEVFLRNYEKNKSPLKPVWVSVVGRISGVRRMAKRLVFLDLAPATGNHGPMDLPWLSAATGQDMAVQLIAGKTLCDALGDEAGEAALKRFKVGQLVLVQGKTNVGNRTSLGNWVEKKSLDIIIHSHSLLEEVGGSMGAAAGVPVQQDTVSVSDFAERILAKKRATRAPANPGMSYMRVNEIYGEPDEDKESHVKMVDTMEAVNAFGNDVSQLHMFLTTTSTPQQQPSLENPESGVSDITQTGFQAGLVGIDCEWRPSFYAESSTIPQPVLLLQVCIHPLKQIYLFDMQALLRPLLLPSEEMNDLEAAVSEVLGELFSSKRLIKTGFQVMQDFRRMAASYPHIPSFQMIHGILEASTLGKKVMHMSKQKNARAAVSSLSRFTERFLGLTLNKEEQISDWSIRPLTAEQMEYAALDAAVTPAIVEKLMESVEAKWFNKPQLGRWVDDVSFSKFITSWRFIFLETDDDKAIRKLKAKRIIGNSYVVTQFWVTGDEAPKLPSPPANGGEGPYTDTDGIFRIPCRMLTIQEGKSEVKSIIAPLLGELVGKSKDRCIARLLSGNPGLPHGSKLDYAQRAGYVEFDDGAMLFVNLPSKAGWGHRRRYPNEWLEDGQIITWFLKENEWRGGTTSLAQKLAAKEDGEKSPAIVLFVRSGKGSFVCCGEARIVDLSGKDKTSDDESEPWALVKLHLILTNWNALQSCFEFRELVNPSSRANTDDESYINGSDDMLFDFDDDDDEPSNADFE
jgi:prolyl-tRNA editing enzyme YbaK/EbsC (Cys-tRNA(Pro) deacylase)